MRPAVGPEPRISSHAVQRWTERVLHRPEGIIDPASLRTACETMRSIMRHGRYSQRPPRWVRDRFVVADHCFVTHELWPGIALVVREDTVATVLLKEVASAYQQSAADRRAQSRRLKR